MRDKIAARVGLTLLLLLCGVRFPFILSHIYMLTPTMTRIIIDLAILGPRKASAVIQKSVLSISYAFPPVGLKVLLTPFSARSFYLISKSSLLESQHLEASRAQD
jgi:hypothetical protein